MKRCPKCGERKPLDAFGVRKRSPSGRKSWCRSCEATRQQERYRDRAATGACVECGGHRLPCHRAICELCRARRSRGRAARLATGACESCGFPARNGRSTWQPCSERAQARHLAQRRGVTKTAYSQILAQQDGRCAICRRTRGTGRSLAVDHDHSTGQVRGLLCFRCNTALARYEEYAAQFAEYLGGARMRTA